MIHGVAVNYHRSQRFKLPQGCRFTAARAAGYAEHGEIIGKGFSYRFLGQRRFTQYLIRSFAHVNDGRFRADAALAAVNYGGNFAVEVFNDLSGVLWTRLTGRVCRGRCQRKLRLLQKLKRQRMVGTAQCNGISARSDYLRHNGLRL